MVGSCANPPPPRLQSFRRPRRQHTHVKLPLSKYSVDGSSGEGSWALLECLAQSDKESQERAGEGYYDEKNKEEDEEDKKRPKGKSGAKRKRVILGEEVASTAPSSSRGCTPNVRLTDQ